MFCLCKTDRRKSIRVEETNGPNSNSELSSLPSTVRAFKFDELASVTRLFGYKNLIGGGGFGKVYKGRLDTGQIVAVKKPAVEKLDRNGNYEFIVEVCMLSILHHSNIIDLIGYCADGDQRILVYDYMSMGSLDDHLFDLEPGTEPLDWKTRMKIAVGAARGLEYLHRKANPPVIHRDVKSSNILLDNKFNPKLSDFHFAILGPVGYKTHLPERLVGTLGYRAPEYAMYGDMTLMCDVYSFGVVLLELITGRRAFDSSRASAELNLADWSLPYFEDRKNFIQMVDPLLQGLFPVSSLQQALAITAMCLHKQPNDRPLMGDVVVALEHLASQP